jgi:hypothetical protein
MRAVPKVDAGLGENVRDRHDCAHCTCYLCSS